MAHFTSKQKTDLYYNDVGQGPTVVLIHGWPLTSAMWEYQALPLVNNGFRVVTYDRRGFGKSAQPASGYDYDTLADDLHELIEHLNLSDVTLAGFSMGGGEIARYLTRHGSQKVKRAALISTVVPFLMKTTDNPDGVDESVLQTMIQGLKEDRPGFLAAFAKQFYGVGLISHPVSEALLNWTSFLAFQASPKATIDCVNAFGKTDFRPDLKSFTMPTLIIHGEKDQTVPIKATGAQAAKAIPGSIYKPYDGAPHGLFFTHKNRLNEDLLSFLKS